MKTLVATRVDIGPTVLRSDIRYNCMTVASDIDSQVRDVTAHLDKASVWESDLRSVNETDIKASIKASKRQLQCTHFIAHFASLET